MKKENISRPENINDRYNLILLEYLKNRTEKQEKQYFRLSSLYPDNSKYTELLLRFLIDKDYILADTKVVESPSRNILPFVMTNFSTTEKGSTALNKKVFPSETNKIKLNEWITYISLAVAILTVIAYIIYRF